MLRIFLFGPPEVTRNHQPVVIPRKKSRALLYYLAAQKSTIPRTRLQTIFWPDASQVSAQQLLRTSLYGLRQELGDALISERDQVGLSENCWVDVRKFEEKVNAAGAELGELAEGVSLYRGEFLEDFSLPDSNLFEEWANIERERYRRLVVRTYAGLGDLYEQVGDYAAALDALDKALEIDPLQEDLQREAIRMAYLKGDRPDAIQRYDALRRMLDRELGVPPMLETRNLYDSILSDTLKKESRPARKPRTTAIASTQARSSSDILPFTGRSEEFRQLNELLNSGRLALIEGEPGVGKTRLAEELLQSSGAAVLRGTAHEMERHLPYQPVIEAFRNFVRSHDWPEISESLELLPVWRREAARIVPEIDPGAALAAVPPQAGVESRLWEAIHQVLQGLGSLRPVILFIDDIQWADESTLALLGYLVRNAAYNVTYLAASRPFPARSPLSTLVQSLSRAGKIERINLSRFSSEEIKEIARKISPSYSGLLVEWLSVQSEGNPYILGEVIRYARQSGILLPNGQVNLNQISASPVVPQTVYSMVNARLANLSEAARRVLDAAVAAGRVFDLDVVLLAAGLSEDVALDAVDELRSSGLIGPVYGETSPEQERLTFTFDHNLTMEVAYRDTGEARHRLMHKRLAEAMVTRYRNRLDSEAGLIAYHFLEGGFAEKAAPYAAMAGDRAVGLAAWKEAISYYEEALRVEKNPERKRNLLLSIAQVRLNSGETARASEIYREALALTEPGSDEANRIKLDLAYSLLPQARFSEAIELIQESISGEEQQNRLRGEFLWGTALSLEGDDLAGAAEHLQRAEQILQEAGATSYLAEIKFEQGSVAAQQGNLEKAVELYRESLQAAERMVAEKRMIDVSVPRLLLAYNNLAYHLHLLGDETAEEYALTGLRLSREQGSLITQTYLLSTLGEIALTKGDLETAEKYFKDGLHLSERISMPERIAGFTANLGLLAVKRGKPEIAIHRLSTAMKASDDLGTRHLSAQIRIWLAPLLAENEARDLLSEARAIAEAGGRKRLLAEIVHLEEKIGSV